MKEYLPYITEYDYPEDATVIGNRCFILNGVTIHHNCHVGLGNIPNSINMDYDTIICSNCNLNGFVHVEKGCELSSGTFVREWMCIAPGAFTAMGEHIVKNVPPFAKILKNRNTGTLEERMKSFNVSYDDLKNIKNITVMTMFY
jgi:acyl-[acyl carrier protein]--UDP-N-acetylglucosamine O-acyltransferase